MINAAMNTLHHLIPRNIMKHFLKFRWLSMQLCQLCQISLNRYQTHNFSEHVQKPMNNQICFWICIFAMDSNRKIWNSIKKKHLRNASINWQTNTNKDHPAISMTRSYHLHCSPNWRRHYIHNKYKYLAKTHTRIEIWFQVKCSLLLCSVTKSGKHPCPPSSRINLPARAGKNYLILNAFRA